jgi:HlyD family secretion protein
MNRKEYMMKRKTMIGIIGSVGVVLLAWSMYHFRDGNGSDKFEVTEITRGDLITSISSSGTLSPVTTVDVGTQVSGSIARIFVDFNDVVQKGQLLAVLDTLMLKISVLDAQAGVDRADAALEQAVADYDRNRKLYDDKLISEAELLPFHVNLKTQQANLKSALASLQRAERNLKYAVIRSPISGTVIQRSVEEGQTVAASFSTPTLFKIAEDLSQMEILADVDESDIGLIKKGQTVNFDVQAYPDRKFTGVVRQIRLQPTVVSNVVTYTVVVNADNEDKVLLPGMTATVDFITATKKDVLLIPNSALRFQPPDEWMQKFRKEQAKKMASLPDSVKEKRRAASAAAGREGTGFPHRPGDEPPGGNFKLIWYLDEDGQPAAERAISGETDGTNTEIVRSRQLKAGMKAIVALSGPQEIKTPSPTPGQPMRMGGRPPL